MTTFVGVNPSFRIWAYDRTTYEVLDYQQWNTNVTEANIVDNATYDVFFGKFCRAKLSHTGLHRGTLLWTTLRSTI